MASAHLGWSLNFQKIDFSLIDLKIRLHIFLFLRTVQKEVAALVCLFVCLFACLLFNVISTFSGYLMPNPSF